MLHGWPLLSSVLLLGVGQLRMCLCSVVGGHGRAGDADLHCEAISTEVMSQTPRVRSWYLRPGVLRAPPVCHRLVLEHRV